VYSQLQPERFHHGFRLGARRRLLSLAQRSPWLEAGSLQHFKECFRATRRAKRSLEPRNIQLRCVGAPTSGHKSERSVNDVAVGTLRSSSEHKPRGRRAKSLATRIVDRDFLRSGLARLAPPTQPGNGSLCPRSHSWICQLLRLPEMATHYGSSFSSFICLCGPAGRTFGGNERVYSDCSLHVSN